MTPKEEAQAAQSLAMMFHGFRQPAVGNVDLQMEVYMRAIRDFELVDIEAAVDRILTGGPGHENREFVPSAPQFCAEVRARAEMRRIREANAKRSLQLVRGGVSDAH